MASFSYRTKLRLAWELTWPLALLDLAIMLVIHGLLDAKDETLDSVWTVVGFFVVSPWVIRRAFTRVYEGLRIGVAGAEGDGPLRYQESLKVMWLLAWRSAVLALVALVVFSLGLRLAGLGSHRFPVESPLWNAVGLSAVDALAS